MDQFDELLKRRAHQEAFALPEDYAGRVFALCAALEEKTVRARSQTARRWAVGIAAALALFVAIPNISAPAAAAMERIPGLGAIVRVITLRSYTYDADHAHADVSVPKIDGSGSAAASVNAEVQAYTDQLIAQFKQDCADMGEGYEGLDVSYSVVTDTDSWFTLRVDALETKASGYEFSKIYNIDKATDQVVKLGGLFREDSDWQTVLTAEVKRQMEAQMAAAPEEKTYFIEDFAGVDNDRGYYFDKDGNLVLTFDEYEIAPGSMGPVEFTVDKAVYQSLLK